MKTLIVYTTILLLCSACSGGGGGPSTQANLVPNGGSQQQQTLNYFTVSTTETPHVGTNNFQITITGSCVIYNSNTYCWDNGAQEVPQQIINHVTEGPWCYEYWISGNGCGALPMGYLPQPTLAQPFGLTSNMTSTAIQTIFQTGVQTQVSCTLSGSVLDCVDFTIDLN